MKTHLSVLILAAALAPVPGSAADLGRTAVQPWVEIDAWPLRLSQAALTDDDGFTPDLIPGELRGSYSADETTLEAP